MYKRQLDIRSGTSSVASGAVTLATGDSPSGNAGEIELVAGTGQDGAAVSLHAGTSVQDNGSGGAVVISSGRAAGSFGSSGTIQLSTPDGSHGLTPGTSGSIGIQTGSVLTGKSGAVSIASGDAVDGRGGHVTVTIGSGDSGHGSDVSMSGGSTSDVGRGGSVGLSSGISHALHSEAASGDCLLYTSPSPRD